MSWIVELSTGERYEFPDYASAYFFGRINFGIMGYVIYQE